MKKPSQNQLTLSSAIQGDNPQKNEQCEINQISLDLSRKFHDILVGL